MKQDEQETVTQKDFADLFNEEQGKKPVDIDTKMAGNVYIKSGNKEVMTSGLVHSFGSEPVKFTFVVGTKKLTLSVMAKVDRNVERPEVRRLPNQDRLDIVFVNPHLQPCVQTVVPEKLGTIMHRDFYCNLRLEAVGTPGAIDFFTVCYTFYLARAVHSGAAFIEVEVDE